MKDSIELREFEPRRLDPSVLDPDEAELIYRRYGKQVAVDFPSPRTGGHYELKSQGWVGYIPMGPDTGLTLAPKVPLQNLFGMWEYAYKLDLEFLKGLKGCASLNEYYDRLACILARKVIDRTRKGLHRAYIDEFDQLPYVRGRIDVRESRNRPGRVSLPCHFQEHQVDVQENRILAWTLSRILRHGNCSDHSLPFLRKAFRGLRGYVQETPCGTAECDSLVYNRLTQDYKPLHALCRFFLDNTGPTHTHGQRRMLPFLMDMATLFEMFVAEWLRRQAELKGMPFKVRAQVPACPSNTNQYRFQIDIVLYDRDTNSPICVIDTKYKNHSVPSHADVCQVVTYAKLMGCRTAYLVYPIDLEDRIELKIGDVEVKCVSFSIHGGVNEAGNIFLSQIGAHLKEYS